MNIFRQKIKVIFDTCGKTASFILLLILYFSSQSINKISFGKINPIRNQILLRIMKSMDRHEKDSISRLDLISLSLRNMKAKKTRTFVTIGGMAIGIGAIVFLVSIGYGLQEMVIARVARLEEMSQTDVTSQVGGKVKINDKTISGFSRISKVKMVLPLIAVVGRVNYRNSVSDMAVYGVTHDYLEQSAIKPVVGKIFDSNDLKALMPAEKGQVAGVTTELNKAKLNEKIRNIDYTIIPGEWVRVRSGPTTSARVVGYTKRTEGWPQGEEIWGSPYVSDGSAGNAGVDINGNRLGKWIKADVEIWQEANCDPQETGDCESGRYQVDRNENGLQKTITGYFAQINVKVVGIEIHPVDVLGITTATDSVQLASDSAMVDWVEIASEAGIIKPSETKTVSLPADAKKQAVVNRAMLKVLGVKESEAVGKKFKTTFVIVGDLLSESNEKIESMPSDYTIIGVTPDEKSPVFYVPFMDVRGLGITNYTQIKMVVDDKSDLFKVRKQIESMGYNTISVSDTVAQINSLFATVRTLLGLLGMVALAVASLGMFNTLTVSLLERTREVGLMKAMGMKSSEVQELFLTESMMMGFLGGILGIGMGFMGGKLVSLGLSFFAVLKGIGFVDVSYIPPVFIFAVIILSLIVGLVTGLYPAYRATKISALNALRYE